MVVGYMRQDKNISQWMYALSAFALMHDIKLFHFTENDVNIDKQEINGQFWDVKKSCFMEKTTPYPHIIADHRNCWSTSKRQTMINQGCVTTWVDLRGKHKVDEILRENGMSDYLLDTCLCKENDTLRQLEQYGTIIIKHPHGLFGSEVYKLSKSSNDLVLHIGHEKKILTMNEFDKYNATWAKDGYIVQEYFESCLDDGKPFDVKAYLIRGENGEWTPIQILPRLGNPLGFVSNTAGGGNFYIFVDKFLQEQFGDKGSVILDEIKYLCKEAPLRLQKGYNKHLTVLGLDIAINKQTGKLKLFEVNGTIFMIPFKMELAAAQIHLFKWLYKQHYDKASAPAQEPVSPVHYISGKGGSVTRIDIVGDLMARTLQQQKAYRSDGVYDFAPSFKYVKKVFDEADLVIGNLETCLSLSSPLRHRQEVIGGTYNCNTHPLYLDAVKDAGIHAVVTANNHCLDAGINGIKETLDVLSKQNIPSTGVFLSSNSKRHMLLGVNGIVIGVLSYSGAGFNGKSRALTPEQKYMINPYSIEALTKDLRAVQADGANLVFVYMHWGLEHTSYVTKQQEEIAHQIAESDVSLIIGSHPHVLQKAGNIQVKNGNFVPIIYSLGNFISDMRYVDENRITAIAHLYLNTKTNSIEKVEFTPCVILDEYKGEDYVIMPLKENNIKRLDKIIEGYGSSCYASAMQVLGDFRMGINDLPGRPR